MGRRMEDFLKIKIPLTKNIQITAADFLAAIVITALALDGRMALFSYESSDYTQFLAQWYAALREAGGFPGLALPIGDYTPSYMYILALLTYLPIRDLYGIKLVSVCFDFLLAAFVLCCVYRRRQRVGEALAAYGIVLFLPTVFLNSAFWGQCDSIVAAFSVMCVYYFLRDRPFAGTLCFSVAFTFKLQTVFLLPFLLVMWLEGRMRGRHFLLIPGAYLLSILPAFLLGRPLSELLGIFLGQTKRYSRLSLNAPNLYFFIYEDRSSMLSFAAITLCGGAVAVALYLLYRRRPAPDGASTVGIALFFSLLLPYLLPHMHERYFYTADVLSLVYAFYRPRRFYLPVLVVFASTACYLPFLFGHAPIDLRFAALVMTAALLIAAYDVFYPLYKRENSSVEP